MQVPPQINLATSQELIPDIRNVGQLTGPFVGLEQALEEDKVILAAAHLNSRAANLLCSALLSAGLSRLCWLLVVVLIVHHQQLHGILYGVLRCLVFCPIFPQRTIRISTLQRTFLRRTPTPSSHGEDPKLRNCARNLSSS